MSFTLIFNIKSFFVDKQPLTTPTIYVLVHFKLSFQNTLTSINRVKNSIFAAAAPLKCVFLPGWRS